MDNQGRSESACCGGGCAKPKGDDRLTEIKAERGKVYGEPKLNHELIAGHWAGLLQPWWERIRKGEPLPPHVVALLMAGLKLNRMRLVYHEDNYDDVVVYLQFAKEWQMAYEWNGGDGFTPAKEKERDHAPGMREDWRPLVIQEEVNGETMAAFYREMVSKAGPTSDKVDKAIHEYRKMTAAKPWQDLVRDFHIKFKHGVGCTIDGYRLRERLIEEESHELLDALGDLMDVRRTMDESAHVAKVAHEAVDLIYVVLGLAVELGVDLDPIFRAVHERNMEKVAGRVGEKPKKPDGWKPVDVAALVREQWRKDK